MTRINLEFWINNQKETNRTVCNAIFLYLSKALFSLTFAIKLLCCILK